MTLTARINKLESVHGDSRVPFIVVSPQPGETERQALKRTLDANGLSDESEAELVVFITKFGPGYKNHRSEQGKIRKWVRNNG